MMPIIEIDDDDFWQTTELDEAIAEEFFGWRWMAFRGQPTKSHPQYWDPEVRDKGIMVRQFLTPKSLHDKRWLDFFEENEGRPADGTEPLAYCYCSSCGPAMVPHFSGHASAVRKLEDELRTRRRNRPHPDKLWEMYRRQLWVQLGNDWTDDTVIDERKLSGADCQTRCIAALAVIGSKYVRRDEEATSIEARLDALEGK